MLDFGGRFSPQNFTAPWQNIFWVVLDNPHHPQMLKTPLSTLWIGVAQRRAKRGAGVCPCWGVGAKPQGLQEPNQTRTKQKPSHNQNKTKPNPCYLKFKTIANRHKKPP